MSYILQFIDSAGFMASLLSNLVNNEESCQEFTQLNVKTNTLIKNVKLTELNINIATNFLNTRTSKMI